MIAFKIWDLEFVLKIWDLRLEFEICFENLGSGIGIESCSENLGFGFINTKSAIWDPRWPTPGLVILSRVPIGLENDAPSGPMDIETHATYARSHDQCEALVRLVEKIDDFLPLPHGCFSSD